MSAVIVATVAARGRGSRPRRTARVARVEDTVPRLRAARVEGISSLVPSLIADDAAFVFDSVLNIDAGMAAA